MIRVRGYAVKQRIRYNTSMKLALPHNYRKITAAKWYLLVLVVLEGILLASLLGGVVFLFFVYSQLQAQREKDLKMLATWEHLITKYPNYPEVYYNAAFYGARVGDREKALQYVEKSLRLNPNFTPSSVLQKELGK